MKYHFIGFSISKKEKYTPKPKPIQKCCARLSMRVIARSCLYLPVLFIERFELVRRSFATSQRSTVCKNKCLTLNLNKATSKNTFCSAIKCSWYLLVFLKFWIFTTIKDKKKKITANFGDKIEKTCMLTHTHKAIHLSWNMPDLIFDLKLWSWVPSIWNTKSVDHFEERRKNIAIYLCHPYWSLKFHNRSRILKTNKHAGIVCVFNSQVPNLL